MKILLIALILSSLAIADNLDHTGNLTNGRGWNAFPATMKAGYLLGLSEGSGFVKADAGLLPISMTFRELSDSLDLFFKEPTNGVIPVTFALMYVKRKALGANEAELNELEAAARKAAQELLRLQRNQ
jgi:hypothetical protein